MRNRNDVGGRSRPRGGAAALAVVSALTVFTLPWSTLGCGDSAPPPASPVVAIDSDEARQALAEDRANRDLLKRKQDKVARRKKFTFPTEPE